MPNTSNQVLRTVDLRTIKSTLKSIHNREASVSENSQAFVDGIFDDQDNLPSTREEFQAAFSNSNRDTITEISEAIYRTRIGRNLESLNDDNKLELIDLHPSNSVSTLRSELSLREVEFARSHFEFTDRSGKIYKFDTQENSILSEIGGTAENKTEAQDIVRERATSQTYKEAAGDTTAPLIGDVTYDPLPRLIHFEDVNHLYVEYWSLGGEKPYYDVNRGDYINIDVREKTALRVHIDDGLIEGVTTKTSDSHIDNVVDLFVEHLAKPSTETDGGLSDFIDSEEDEHEEKLWNDIDLTDNDIVKANEQVGILSTLLSFRGLHNNYSATSREDSEVSIEDIVDQIADGRDLRRSHVQVVLAAENQNDSFEIKYPHDIEQQINYQQDMSIEDVVEAYRDATSYHTIQSFTVVLNTDKNTIRVWKPNCSPQTRRLVFHSLASELGW